MWDWLIARWINGGCWFNALLNWRFRYTIFLRHARILNLRNTPGNFFVFSFSSWRLSRIIFSQINLFTWFMLHCILACYYFLHWNFVDIVVIIGVNSWCWIVSVSNCALFSCRIQWFHNFNFSLFQILFYFDRCQAGIIIYNGRWLCKWNVNFTGWLNWIIIGLKPRLFI